MPNSFVQVSTVQTFSYRNGKHWSWPSTLDTTHKLQILTYCLQVRRHRCYYNYAFSGGGVHVWSGLLLWLLLSWEAYSLGPCQQ